jgi:hypothetical protein
VRGGIKKSSSKCYGSLSSTLPGRTDFGKAGFVSDNGDGFNEGSSLNAEETKRRDKGVPMSRYKVDTSGRAEVL